MPFDFIICGSEQPIAQWPKHALSIDLITEVNPDLHYIRAGNLAMDVIRFENLYDFVKHDAEAAIMITRKPAREKAGYDDLARQVVGLLFDEMDSGDIACFEPVAEKIWVQFQPDINTH